MKFATDRLFADPDQAARKLLELANAAEADRDQRIPIELINPAIPARWRECRRIPGRHRARESPRDGCGGMSPASMSGSPQPAPSCSPDEMPNLMPDKGWRRHFEEPIPLPDEMAAKPRRVTITISGRRSICRN